MRLHTIALGCQMSAADSAEMAEPLLRRGFSRTDAAEEADAILISTCTVRQHAEHRALSLIGRFLPWKQKDPSRVLIVAGCAAERLGGGLQRRFPHVDLVVGSKSVEDFGRIVEESLGRRLDALLEGPKDAPESSPQARSPTGSRATAFVTIMRGCNGPCAYCVVPAVRGPELCRPVETILDEVRRRVEAGAREITLLGQTVNSYSAAHAGRRAVFADLLRLVDAIPGVERLRFMSPHPRCLDDAMIAAMAECPSVCEFLHLPAQSGSDRILRLMRRGYTRQSYLLQVEKARKAIPGVVLSTDFIVGFPSETEEDFSATMELLESLKPASAFCFKYSPREPSECASWPDDVPPQVKEERLRRLNEAVEVLTQEALRRQSGRTVQVLTEQASFGRTRDGFKVRWKTPAAVGELVRVPVTGTTRRTLLGEAHEH